MANIIVDPIPFNPGAVANGTPYTPDARNNYITIPNLTVTADLSIPAQTFEASYTALDNTKTVSHAMAVIADSSYTSGATSGSLNLTFNAQVFYTDDTSDFEIVEASILVNKPTDFNTFAIDGSFTPVIPAGGVSAAYDTTDPTLMVISIDLEAITLGISGTASVRVRVATEA